MIRSVKFWIGCFVLAALVGSSLVHQFVFDSNIKKVVVLYNEKDEAVKAAPLPASLEMPFGTDRQGYDMFAKVVQGAKYTIPFAILIALLRVVIAFFIAIPYAFYFPLWARKGLEKLLSSFYYVPLTILAIFLLQPVLTEQLSGDKEYFTYSFFMRIFLEVSILTLLVVPLVSVMIGNMITAQLKEEFIQSSQVLGAGKLRIFMKHVVPHLLPKLFIVVTQQCVSALIIFAHLGYFQLFIGGTDVCYAPFCDIPPQSISNEWSGLIGEYYQNIFAHPLIALGPVIMFGIAIYSFNLVTEGLQTHFESGRQREKADREEEKEDKIVTGSTNFKFINQEGA
ncbi:ABC transporter permease subunit [Fictibacillus sp. KIGAM418]|uniref:ABC transporter permease subunit n=1 Tax=Fictibacillus marinisediminis TaxID=2878389 RepID=A0A9X1XG24_9BACL|nr:ABC transporter permease subunit [Fictibacillus marinisediminis]MCK6258405.1 ABC transporter permease subunit [Fictibacillus marinisediminis]